MIVLYAAATPTTGSEHVFVFASSNSNDATPASTNKVIFLKIFHYHEYFWIVTS